MLHKRICTYIFALAISLMLPLGAFAQKSADKAEADIIPLFRGLSVSVDAVGLLQLAISDYGQYEAALRLNLRDKYLPIIEIGYGTGKHDEDVVTGISTKTSAPYGRIGCDFNILKNKHERDFRLFAGFRYAFTAFNFEVSHPGIKDPVWGNTATFQCTDNDCNFHWLEGVFGLDTRIAGPLRLGWTARYRRKLTSNNGNVDGVWYVPGFGKYDSSNWGGTFNVILEI